MVLTGPELALLGPSALWWANFGWPTAATVRHCAQFGLSSHSTFVFYIDPLTNDGVPGAISEFPGSAPLPDPTGGNGIFLILPRRVHALFGTSPLLHSTQSYSILLRFT